MLKFIAWIGKMGCGFMFVLFCIVTVLALNKPSEEDLIRGTAREVIGTDFGAVHVLKPLLEKFLDAKIEREDWLICSALVFKYKDGKTGLAALGVFGKVFGPKKLKKLEKKLNSSTRSATELNGNHRTLALSTTSAT